MNILITGGASGLGAAITKAFAANAANKVNFTYHHSVNDAGQLEELFGNTTGIKCDFSDAQQVQELSEAIKRLNLDVLINNAYSGKIEPCYFHKTNKAVFLSDFENNLLPVIKITQATIQAFRKKKQGRIITVLTSYLENVPPMGMSAYVAGKAYLKQLTKVWAAENAALNITSNSVSPSFMQTGLTNDTDERVIEQMSQNHPLKKLLQPEEVAQTIYEMANGTSHMNGVDLVLNAGVNMR